MYVCVFSYVYSGWCVRWYVLLKGTIKLQRSRRMFFVARTINHSTRARGWNISCVIFVHIWPVRSAFASTNTLSHTQIQLNLTQQWIINKPAAKLTCHINQFLFTNLITWHEKEQALKLQLQLSSFSATESWAVALYNMGNTNKI